MEAEGSVSEARIARSPEANVSGNAYLTPLMHAQYVVDQRDARLFPQGIR
jgi:hypothetical protein